jgi:hypothetical protein
MIDITPNNSNPFKYSNTQSLTVSMALKNLLKDSGVSYTIELPDDADENASFNFDISPSKGKIAAGKKVQINVQMDYEKLNPNEVNDCHFVVKATAGKEKVDKVTVKISCLPRQTSIGKYQAKIRFDISSKYMKKTLERSQIIDISGAKMQAIEDEKVDDEEQNKRLESELAKMAEHMENEKDHGRFFGRKMMKIGPQGEDDD